MSQIEVRNSSSSSSPPLLTHKPPVGHDLLIHVVSRSHTMTQHSRQYSSGRVISPSQRPLPDNTQQSQQTAIHAPGGIRTHDISRRAAVYRRFGRRGAKVALINWMSYCAACVCDVPTQQLCAVLCAQRTIVNCVQRKQEQPAITTKLWDKITD